MSLDTNSKANAGSSWAETAKIVVQALANAPITVFGTGQQTRSLCYVDDLVDGLMLLAEVPVAQPVNLGNPEEYTVLINPAHPDAQHISAMVVRQFVYDPRL